MSIPDFLEKQDLPRKELMLSIHDIIIESDATVEAIIGTMMGKEMILYNCKGTFKYGLASVKNYMSLHLMPIYASPKLHDKYARLLHKASFQKGCINFKNPEEMPLEVVKELMDDSAKIDMLAIREEYQHSKKVSKWPGEKRR